MEIFALAIGLVMLGALGLLAGSLARDGPRMRARWDSRFDCEDRGAVALLAS